MAGKKGQKRTPVVQIDIYGNEIARFVSIYAASLATNIPHEGIWRAVRYQTKQAGGYRWRKVADTYIPHLTRNIDYPTQMAIINRHIYYPFETIRDLAEWFGISHEPVSRIIKNFNQSVKALEAITKDIKADNEETVTRKIAA